MGDTIVRGMVFNYILIAMLIGGIIFAVYYIIKKLAVVDEEVYENIYTEQHIKQAVAEVFAAKLKQNLKDMNLDRKTLELRNKERSEIRRSLKEAAYGNRTAKKFIKSYIKDVIRATENIGINEETINRVIRFDEPSKLKPKDKFEICLYVYNKKYELEGFTTMIDVYELNRKRYREDGNLYYEIDKNDIDKVYKDIMKKYTLTYDDKLEILSQRIFELYKGLSVVDMLFDSTIDEVDGGVSGMPKDSYEIRRSVEEGDATLGGQTFSYECCWITYKGVNIKLSCLPFDTQEDLIRVCQNIYKFNTPASLSRRNGAVVSTMKDGSRIVVARPPFCDSWAFFARKFDSTPSIAPQDLFRDAGSSYVVTTIKWLIRGHRNMMVTGSQGTGKTTTLKSVLRFVPEPLTLRIQEKAFEMNLRYVYPGRNIVTFQETETISMQEGLNLQKKTNGCVNVFGEIASAEASGEYLQTCRVASLMGIGTHHAKTSRDLVRSFAINGETEESVSQTINFDIHMENEAGHRFCQRITEIIPIRDRRYPSEMNNGGANLDDTLKKDTIEYQKRMTDRQVFEVRDIVIYDNGVYKFVNSPTQEAIDAICMNLPGAEKDEFLGELANMVESAKKEGTLR